MQPRYKIEENVLTKSDIILFLVKAASNVELSLRFSAVKEKLTREKLSLVDSDSSDGGLSVDMELVARVLGKGKGTPMLRDGIRCIGTLAQLDSETEASDWQGF